MLFNSFPFLIFFTVFFLLYWLVFGKNVKQQNFFLLAGGYFFYAWADWRFLALLLGISVLNYFLAIFIQQASNHKRRRVLLLIGLIQGIGGLFFFKYFNFFIASFRDAFKAVNIQLDVHSLNLIIPLGISFFTFKAMGYLLDVEKGKIEAVRQGGVFFTWVAFFPTLLSGPIDKAKTLIPQLQKKRVFDYDLAVDGMRQVLWGLFKKIVIADNCSGISSLIFDGYQSLPASTLLIGAVFYTVQVYADFSGYSDMAIGFSRIIGFKITKNFDYPFFSQNIAEFWRKWHISLTAWFTEHVFTPLTIAFRDWGNVGLSLAIVINFTIIGMWHGANWTYVVFGLIHGCFFIPLVIRGVLNKKSKLAKGKLLPSFREALNMMGTFLLLTLTIFLFRAESISQAYDYYKTLFSASLFSLPKIPGHTLDFVNTGFFIFLMLLTEWMQRNKEYGLQIDNIKQRPIRLGVYYTVLFIIILFGGSEQAFIYSQF